MYKRCKHALPRTYTSTLSLIRYICLNHSTGGNSSQAAA